MSNPFRDPSIWVRTLAFSAATLGISVGLCGLNIGASSLVHPALGPPGGARSPILEALGPVLSITGFLEMAGMAIGVVGMVLSGLAILVQLFWRLATGKRP